jgi:hypothetical protein
MKLKPGFLILIFAVLLLIINYYDLFYVLYPVRSPEFGKPTLSIYLGVNFLPKVIYYLLKFFFISLLIYGISWAFKYRDETSPSAFKEILGLVISSEFIFILQKMYILVYFEFIETDYSFEDYIYFYPFTLYDADANKFHLVNQISKDLGLFDVIYILIMMAGLTRIFDISALRSSALVLTSYIVPLILWVAFLNFLGF